MAGLSSWVMKKVFVACARGFRGGLRGDMSKLKRVPGTLYNPIPLEALCRVYAETVG